MICKVAKKDGKDWGCLLFRLLFAYKEIPQASTGFSPFELLYNWDVRGPLDVLQESWEAGGQESESIISYVLLMRERLSKMTDLMQTTLGKASERQKLWYDYTARFRKFTPDNKVLVLLPTSTKKLLAQWQGPYPIVSKVRKVNYEVDIKDKSKHKKVFHINMLKPFHAPEAVACFGGEEYEEQ